MISNSLNLEKTSKNSPASKRPGASTPMTLRAEAEAVPPTREQLKEKLERLKEVRDLCQHQAENGSFLTLAALIAAFSLGVLPTLKYDDKYYDDKYYAFFSLNLTLTTATEGCDPCAWIEGTFLNHALLAYTQAILLGLTGILSAVSMIGFFLVFLKGTKILSSLPRMVDEAGSTWKETIVKADSLNDWKFNPPSEMSIIKSQIYTFLKFWARYEVTQSLLRGIFWLSLTTLMLSCAVSPNLYCFHCKLGICISALMVFGCLTVLIVVTCVDVTRV